MFVNDEHAAMLTVPIYIQLKHHHVHLTVFENCFVLHGNRWRVQHSAETVQCLWNTKHDRRDILKTAEACFCRTGAVK